MRYVLNGWNRVVGPFDTVAEAAQFAEKFGVYGAVVGKFEIVELTDPSGLGLAHEAAADARDLAGAAQAA